MLDPQVFALDLKTEKVIDLHKWLSEREMRIDTLLDKEFFEKYNLKPIRLPLTIKYNEYVDSITPRKVGDDYEYDFVIKTLDVIPQHHIDERWRTIREVRNRLLAETDWTQMSDIDPLTREKYAKYRQELRDVTKQPDPFNLNFPKKPQ